MIGALLRRHARLALVLLAVCLCGTVAAHAATLALGASGEVYMLRSGTYGQLFPSGTDASPDTSVLALDMMPPNAPLQRLLVPGTAGDEEEDAATLVYEDASGSVFVLWESLPSPIHPILKIASFNGTAWSNVIQILGNYYARKSSPQMVITHDVIQTTAADGTVTPVRRTVLHTLWAEDNATGTQDTFYTPIILDNGFYLGSSPLFRLNGLDPSPVASSAPDVAANLLVAPHLQAGRDDRTVIATFADADTRRIATVEIAVLPRELSNLADDARAHIIGVGATDFPGSLSALAADARAHIIGVGVNFQPEVVTAMANDVATLITAADPTTASLSSIADDARAHIIGIGARMSSGGLRSMVDISFSSTQQVAEIAADPASGGDGVTHLIRFGVAASRLAPRIGPGNVEMYLSPDGQKLVLSWESDTSVSYREQSTGAWGDVRQLALGDTLSLDAARQILAQRALNR